MRLLVPLLILLLAACADAPAQQGSRAAAALVSRPAEGCVVQRIIDGDTLVCESGERVRLLLIDAPERGQPAYADSRRALLEIVPAGMAVRLDTDVQARDRYGRTLAYVWTPAGLMANEEMVRRGFALVLVYPPNVRHVERLRRAAADARAARRGLWATDGFACAPREYRRGECGRR